MTAAGAHTTAATGTLDRLAEGARVRLGSAGDTAPDMLRELAFDASVTVRAAVAMNRATPMHADQALAVDGDERVRTLLARKLALLIPNLPQIQRGMLEQHVLTTLGRLVDDEAVRVRAAIADVVKEMPDAPRELILQLAHDSALPVSEPVIRLSPLLTAEDLLALLADAPMLAIAVARRPALPSRVADAVALSPDTQAVTALLANRTAAIREATLDRLSLAAGPHAEWHEPLVRRPVLSARAARALSEIVTTQLLGLLASRGDLDPQVTEELRRRLADRFAAPAPERSPRSLAATDEPALAAAVRQGDTRLCAAILANAAGVRLPVVERAVKLRSAKGLVSLVWRAGFSMQVAVPLQALLCRLEPAATLRGGEGGSFPLTVEDMRWHLELLERMGR